MDDERKQKFKKHKVKYIIGILSGLIATFAFLPQVIMTYKNRRATELTFVVLITVLISKCGWVGYGILDEDYIVVMWVLISMFLFIMLLMSKFIFPK